jgi:hypothetical protein
MTIEKRLAALEQAMGRQRTIGILMPDAEADPDEFLDELIRSGQVAAEDRDRVLLVRWQTKAESEAKAARERADRDIWPTGEANAQIENFDA